MAKQDLDCIFNPQSVAFVGVSTEKADRAQQTGERHVDVGGTRFLRFLLDYGFKGKIYPVNPKGGEILGLKVYPNIKDVPEPVDYVICSVSAPQVPQLVKDCIAKGVKTVHIYSGGFSETGTEQGKRLEEEISSLARQSGIHIIGPNCMGVYYPRAGLSIIPDFSKESGSASLICQSGGNSVYLVREGARRGIKFSKVISYGNACDVDETDLLEYLAQDSDTKIIAAYIEGVKDGQRFHRVLKEAAKAKPVIVLKGGVTEAGERAAASHTGALAGSTELWVSLLHQMGAIRVCGLEELIDMVVTFTYLPVPSGRRTAVLGIGGGTTVLASDDCTSAGLEVPRLPAEIQNSLRSYVKWGGTGTSLNNPVDLSVQAIEPFIFHNCAQTLLDYEGLDLLIVQLPLSVYGQPLSYVPSLFTPIIECIIKIYKETSKPMAVVIHLIASGEIWQLASNFERRCYEAGLPVYRSLTNAAKAIACFIDYHKRRKGMLG
jgi:acyl-CoA synthetase (NDP forming)